MLPEYIKCPHCYTLITINQIFDTAICPNCGDIFKVSDVYENEYFYFDDWLIYGKCLKKYYGDDLEVSIPDGITSIGDYALANCSEIMSLIIPDSVTSIGDYAFANCSGIESITIPNSVESIGFRAFSNCSNLKYVIASSYVFYSAKDVFYNCKKLMDKGPSNSYPRPKMKKDIYFHETQS